jgi:hypothetical protein
VAVEERMPLQGRDHGRRQEGGARDDRARLHDPPGRIQDRLALEAPDAGSVDDELRFLEAAAEAGELAAVADAAARLRGTVEGLAPRA